MRAVVVVVVGVVEVSTKKTTTTTATWTATATTSLAMSGPCAACTVALGGVALKLHTTTNTNRYGVQHNVGL